MRLKHRIIAGAVCTLIAATLWAAEPVNIMVSPNVLALTSRTTADLTVHADVKWALVDAASVTLNGLPALSVFADDCGDLVAKFDRDAVKALANGSPEITLTLTAVLMDGTEIVGSDTIRVR